MTPTAAAAGRFLPEGQGVRAVAVVLVVLFHAWPAFVPGDYVGVDVFFVVSGFLITRLLLREVETSGRIDFVALYARRLRRLLPALVLVVAAVMAASWMLRAPLERKMLTSSAVASLVYLSNLWFARQSTDHLGDDARDNPLLHTWSLSVEEQFYLVWPALVWVVASGAIRSRGNQRACAGIGFLVVTLGSLARAQWRGRNPESSCKFEAGEASQAIIDRMWPIEGLGPSNVRLFDPTQLVCQQRLCSTERDGVVLYSDSHHLTATYSRSLAPRLSGAVQLSDSSFTRPVEKN